MRLFAILNIFALTALGFISLSGTYAQDFLDPQPLSDDASLGSLDAKVILVEFSDFNCGFCGRFHKNTLKLIKEKYIDTGKLHYVYRDFIGVGGATSLILASSMECVRAQKGDEVYLELMERLYAHSGRKSTSVLLAWLPEYEVDMTAFSTCALGETYQEEVLADTKAGQQIGMRGTPGFVIGYLRDGEIIAGSVLQGALPYKAFEKFIESYLAPEGQDNQQNNLPNSNDI